MLSFEPSVKLEKALKQLQGQVVNAAAGLSTLEPAEAQYLNRCALVSNVGASTRIENALLTDAEVEWVDTTLSVDGRVTAFEQHKAFILDKLSKDRERSVEEVVGCREVLATVYAQARDFVPLTEMVIRGLHHDLLRFYPQASPYAGAYKTSPNRVISKNHATGEVRTVLDPAAPGIITETAMAELVAWYNANRHETPWPLLVATEFVFRFLAIHPFQDGNGRIGRALFLLALLQSDDAPLATLMPYVALDRRIEQNRAKYYAVLHEVSQGQFHADPAQYHYEPLVWFFLKMLEGALRDVAHYRERYARLQKLSEATATVLQSFKLQPEQRLRVNDIVIATQLPRRTVQYALKTLTDQGFLQRLGQGAGVRYQLVF
ncbi:Fic family protein [Sulfuritortus calidifontis]|uniref:Fic family protein n=1 Tax=Sulfuritortus calidifontis TaxID=1914471 RepID=A0A4R3JQ62_9PROT|nr:Fic family protein [Sulfuritortus calidifontis]TCS68994.1 Fic family protein [Sulfuritortus calidifontis]